MRGLSKYREQIASPPDPSTALSDRLYRWRELLHEITPRDDDERLSFDALERELFEAWLDALHDESKVLDAAARRGGDGNPEETINVFSRAGLGDVQDVMAWVYPSNQAKQHRLATWWNCKPDWTRTPQAYKNPTDKRVKMLIEAGKMARGYDWVEINHVKNVAGIGHHCPIPYDLAERLVLSTTEPGDLVCDPFAGSGTVLLAAIRNGRRAMGFELSEHYCDIANRLLAEQSGSTLAAARAGQTALWKGGGDE